MASIKDVAKLAQVSVGSVSKYLNGGKLKEKTTIAIEQAIKDLNYEKNTYATGLRTNRTHTIALIIPTIWHPFFSELAFYIEAELRNYQSKLILCNTQNNYENEVAYISMARQNKVDGLIALTYSNVDEYISSEMPIVSIDRYFSEKIPTIMSDNFAGGGLAAEKLIQAGAKKLAFIGYGSIYDNSTRDRYRGFQAYCQTHGIESEIIYYEGRHHEFNEKLPELVQQIIINKAVNGIFVVNDEQAYEVLELLQKNKVRVPEDVQVIGFDGSQQSTNIPSSLSSIRQPIPAIAAAAVKCLINVIEKKEAPLKTILPVTYHPGATTKE
ncbi:LacI family transcriptional regulator [Trichococcus patagoniensis]|uniref:LacI family transcriptional regulator n=1 Tax=Trichococcus patagoniensis TaxID=382641 RepID=A0A2T5IQ64_9LACT|nr:LacI family DNA-binding transcriptional regulator [Trichococcus patagoniensis]PTQ85961.1 LacI family transcriptional regulator [Trichococcus patagoniensis]